MSRPTDENVEILARLSMTADFAARTFTGQMTDFIDKERGNLDGTLGITAGTIGPADFGGTMNGTVTLPSGDPIALQADIRGAFYGDDAEFVAGDVIAEAGFSFPADRFYCYGVFVAEK